MIFLEKPKRTEVIALFGLKDWLAEQSVCLSHRWLFAGGMTPASSRKGDTFILLLLTWRIISWLKSELKSGFPPERQTQWYHDAFPAHHHWTQLAPPVQDTFLLTYLMHYVKVVLQTHFSFCTSFLCCFRPFITQWKRGQNSKLLYWNGYYKRQILFLTGVH